jgi:hypothetical protein
LFFLADTQPCQALRRTTIDLHGLRHGTRAWQGSQRKFMERQHMAKPEIQGSLIKRVIDSCIIQRIKFGQYVQSAMKKLCRPSGARVFFLCSHTFRCGLDCPRPAGLLLYAANDKEFLESIVAHAKICEPRWARLRDGAETVSTGSGMCRLEFRRCASKT